MGRGLNISFDFDGTLTTPSFVDGVWHEGLPACISRQRGISLSSAAKMCADTYDRMGDASIEWYRLPYWIEYFELTGTNPADIVSAYSCRIALYDDVIPCLQELRTRGYPLILFSNASRDFLDIEVSAGSLKPYFDTIISVSDDWGMVKADASSYERLRSLAGEEIVHIGDHLSFDCEIPRSTGMAAYHIWRGSGPKTGDSLMGLAEVTGRIVGEKG